MINQIKTILSKVYNLSLNKQFIFFGCLTVSVIVGVMAVNWLKTPNYTLLFNSLSSNDQQAVLKVLDANAIPYKLLPTSGGVTVADSDINKARMLLAKQGLPRTYQNGYDLLTKSQGIYTNQMNEELIKKKILEENLEKSINTINGIEAVKVQLALPKHTDFMEKVNEPKASVVLKLRPGITLTNNQVDGIVHLVSSSIPYMKLKDVTIVDQTGLLLTSDHLDKPGVSQNMLQLKDQLENNLRSQILSVLTPIVGRENLRVEVHAKLDLNQKTNTTEKYIPNKKAIESEQEDNTEQSAAASTVEGIPGALSNQPPGRSTFAEKAQRSTQPNVPFSKHERKTMNYALGKSITHTNFSTGNIEKLSVAILLNDLKENIKGKIVYKPHSANQIRRIELLAKNAIGFDERRGDKIAVSSAKFYEIPFAKKVEDAPVPLTDQAWFLELIKGGLLLIGLLIFALFIWRPFQKYLFLNNNSNKDSESLLDATEVKTVEESNPPPPSEGVNKFDESVSVAKSVITDRPDVAASVIKDWVNVNN